jgi:hypothetical protein
LVQNLKPPVGVSTIGLNRQRLLERNSLTIAEALGLLRSKPDKRGWYIFEGQTFPDALLVTPDALIVVE